MDPRSGTTIGTQMALRCRADHGVPTRLIRAEQHADMPLYMAQARFPLLTGAPNKKLVVIGDGTLVVLTERNRKMRFRAVDRSFGQGRR